VLLAATIAAGVSKLIAFMLFYFFNLSSWLPFLYQQRGVIK
jgi:hypothetical protein